MNILKARPRLLSAAICLVALHSSIAVAGFLEMPDTTEVPEMERESMLRDLDIPAVRERDPDPLAGPRLNITEFRVQGIVEYPELGITRESLNRLVEGIRFEMMGEGEMLDSGYTLEEVSEISDMVAQIEDETQGEHVGPLEVQRLVFLIREQRRRRGVTVGMIENVADTITRYYRERGFILAKAYIPEQHVRDGVVTLTLLLGELGEIDVQNNKKYKASTIERIFDPVINKPVTAKNIEERLFFVNDMPGLSAQAYFEPGSQVGDTRLNINVVTEKMFAGNVRLDNHGSDSTGEYRLYTDGYWYNPLGIGDQLHIGVLGTFEPANSMYGSIHYGVPLFSPRAKFTVGGSSNDFVSEVLDGLTTTGDSVVLDASLNYILKRSRVKNYSVEARFAEIDTDITNVLLPENDVDEGNAVAVADSVPDNDYDMRVRNLDLVFNFDVLHEKMRALHQGGVRLTYADIIEGRRFGQREKPLVFAVNYSLLKFVQLPFTDIHNRVIFRFAGQYADGALPSTSQLSLTGPTRMRGFEVNTYNADHGVAMGLDWVMNTPELLNFNLAGQEFKDLLQPYIFVDAAYGVTNVSGSRIDASNPWPGVVGTWARLADVGFGFKFNLQQFRSNISFARAVDFKEDLGSGSARGLNDLEVRNKLYFDMQYSF